MARPGPHDSCRIVYFLLTAPPAMLACSRFLRRERLPTRRLFRVPGPTFGCGLLCCLAAVRHLVRRRARRQALATLDRSACLGARPHGALRLSGGYLPRHSRCLPPGPLCGVVTGGAAA